MIPLKYNIRNLRVRWVSTLMTILVTALVVWITVLAFGLTDGLKHALRISGHPLELLVLRQGATDESGSTIAPDVARQIANLDGIEKDATGQPLCSIEFSTILTKPRTGSGGTANLIVRGLDDVGRKLRPDFTIVEGRDIQPGRNEAITSRSMSRRFKNLAIGESLEINRVQFNVVGYFEAGGSSAESEVWTARADLTAARREAGAVSSVDLRAQDEASKEKLSKVLQEDDRFKLKVVDETKYFEDQMSASIVIQFVGTIIAIFCTGAAMFAVAITMFAAVASRGREIGTLRALGFPRRSILASFLLEALVLCGMGGILGCLLIMPANGVSTGTANWATFAEITFSFRFGPMLLLFGFALTLLMGLVGGLFPAIRAIRMQIVSALRA